MFPVLYRGNLARRGGLNRWCCRQHGEEARLNRELHDGPYVRYSGVGYSSNNV